jgi:ribosome-associated translation inhibitor RaiA
MAANEVPMTVTVTCINMDHDFYVRNYAEARLQQRSLMLTHPPTEAEIVIRSSAGMKYVSCEVVALGGQRIFVEHSGHDLYKLINDVTQRVITNLSLSELRLKNTLSQPGTNVIDFLSKRQLLKKGTRSLARDFQP